MISAVPALGQSSLIDLNARLLHQHLFLKGQWGETQLKFDSSGQLLGKAAHFSFTLAGIDVHSVKLSDKGLRVDGERVGLTFPKGKMLRQPLGENIRIEIEPAALSDYTEALDAIFYKSAADYIPTLPVYWKGAYTEALLTGSPLPAPAKAVAEQGIKRIGGAVTAPRALRTPEPDFNDFARALKINGVVLVYLQVDLAGNAVNVRILHPLGIGLDERAVAAVANYKFKPATENGVPVRVEMNVEVNFQTFSSGAR